MPDLDLTKELNKQQSDLNGAEKEFFSAVRSALMEAMSGVGELRSSVIEDIYKPLEAYWRQTRDAGAFKLLKDINVALDKYNNSVTSARSQFVIGFGREMFDREYASSFDVLYIRYRPQLDIELGRLSGLGALPVILLAKTALTSHIWEAVASRLMQVPIIRDIVVGVLEGLYSVWSNTFFFFRPEEKKRRDELEKKAKFLKYAMTLSTNGFNTLITAIQVLQTNIEKKMNEYFAQAEKEQAAEAVDIDNTERKVYVPYTILPEPLQKEIAMPAGSRAASVEYKREYKPLSGSSFSDFTDGEGKFSIMQYATHILIDRERFPYDRTTY